MTEEPQRHARPSKLVAMLVLSVVGGLLLAVMALPIVGGLGVTAKASADFFTGLPSALVQPSLAERSVILDRNGNRLATLHGAEDRVSVPVSDIPVAMRHAIVAIEDRRFYEHHGIDYRGIIRAALTNQENGNVTQGGSTLTQQYVKNVLIEEATTPAELKEARERTVQRKIREARYALQLERTLSKNQILANYLNIANFGDGAYGVEAAAQHYFGIHAKQLNIVQSALLAGIVNSPTAYNSEAAPESRARTAQPGARPDGFIEVHNPGAAEVREDLSPRAHEEQPPDLRRLRARRKRRLLLCLCARHLAERSEIRCDAGGAAASPVRGRPHHQDLARPGHSGRCAERGGHPYPGRRSYCHC
jgi:membrane peptidoglycan carboxypeptidase